MVSLDSAPIIGHIHVPKCAGTSFRHLLGRYFGPRHLNLYVDDTYYVYSDRDLDGFLQDPAVRAFSSHHVRRYPRRLGGRDIYYVTFLRDPIQQFISYLTHVKKYFGAIKSASLLDALPPDAPELSSRALAKWILTHSRDIPFRQNYTVNFLTHAFVTGADRLAAAKSALGDFFFVGIAERMEQSVSRLQGLARAAGLDFPVDPITIENSSSECRDDLSWINPGDEVGSLLLRSVREDQGLYQWALRRFEKERSKRPQPERSPNLSYEPALHTLLVVYESRPDLQAAFPEVAIWDFRRLIDWARRVVRREFADHSAETLQPVMTGCERLNRDSGVQYAGKVTPAKSVCEAYHDWYYSQEVWKTTKFLGILACKSVSDLWNYQEILTELKPSLVLELGTYHGGSSLYFAEILKLISPHFRVLTVDIDHSVVAERVRQHDRIELLESDTTSLKVAVRFKEMRRAYPGKAFCIVDSDHSKEHVIRELMLLRDVTEPGDCIIVEDGNINGHPVLPDWGPGPYEAIQEYVERYPDDYISDVEREKKFGFTFAPKGFLIRRDSHT